MDASTPASARFHTSTVRRVVGALAALALAGGLAASPVASAAARAATTRVSSSSAAASTAGAVLATKVGSFVASLDARDAEALRSGDPHIPGTGLRLGDLDEERRERALDLLPSLVSPAAWVDLADLVASDDARGALEEYHLALFGDTGADFALQVSTPDLVLIAVRQGDEVDVAPELVA